MNIHDYRHLYKTTSGFDNVKKAVKRLNTIRGLPVDGIHLDEWESDFDLMVQGVIETMQFPSNINLYTYLIPISGLCKKAGIKTEWSTLCRSLLHAELDFSDKKPVRPWNKLLELFENHIDNNPCVSAKIICICYKHGYVLTIKEITETHLHEEDTNKNFLDLETSCWTVRTYKKRKTPVRRFYVSRAFLEELASVLQAQDEMLLCKTNGSYNTQKLPFFGITDFTVHEARNSLENLASTLPDQNKRCRYSSMILGHQVKRVLPLVHIDHLQSTQEDPESEPAQ